MQSARASSASHLLTCRLHKFEMTHSIDNRCTPPTMPTSGSVTLTLQGGGDGHRFGVNGMAFTQSNRLLSAGRDGTVRCWDLSSDERARLEYTLDEHSDWVNGIAAVQGDIFATCSSDRSVKLWSLPAGSGAAAQLRCETIGRHDDYVKAIAFASQRSLLATAGFDCRVVLWDVQRLALVSASHSGAPSSDQQPTAGAQPSGISAHRDSIYALDCDTAGTVIATGSVDKDVRLWDPRDLRSSRKLQGHSDIVRCVQLVDNGARAVSCSSDCTVRIWNVAEQRCELTLAPHSSSIFAVRMLEGGRLLLSGDRAGHVRLTDLASARSALLCSAEGSVHSLTFDSSEAPRRERLWVASSASTIQCWDASGLEVSESAPSAARFSSRRRALSAGVGAGGGTARAHPATHCPSAPAKA